MKNSMSDEVPGVPPMRFLRLALVVQLVGLALGAIWIALLAAANGRNVVTEVVVPVGVIVVVVVLGTLAMRSIFLPGRLRTRRIAAANPGAIAFTAQTSELLLEAMAAHNDRTADITLRAITCSVSADNSGIAFWEGLNPPKVFFDRPWHSIARVEASEHVGVNGKRAGVLRFVAHSPAPDLEMRMAPSQPFGLSTPAMDVVEPLAHALEGLRADSKQNS